MKRRTRTLTPPRPTTDLCAATLDAVRGGRNYDTDTTQEDPGQQVYLHYELENVRVSNYSISGSGG